MEKLAKYNDFHTY